MKVIQRIRESRTGRVVFTFMLLNILFEILQPTVSLALTSGPSQPEVQSFEPVGTTDMVDVFTGDFNYNIPLMNIPGPNGGYPINLAYHAGVSMDDEASWVGLGWNINNGALVRNVRGLPDDFNSSVDGKGDYASGDFIERKVDQKESVTVGLGTGTSLNEAFGAETTKPGWQFNLQFNNYRGLGYSINYGFPYEENAMFKAGLSLDSDDGLGVNITYSFDQKAKAGKSEYDANIGFNGNSGLSASLRRETTKSDEKNAFIKGVGSMRIITTSKISRSSNLSYANTSFSPVIGSKVNTYNVGFSLLTGKSGLGFFQSRPFTVFFSTEDYDGDLKDGKQYPVLGYQKMGSPSSTDEEYYTQDFARQSDGVINRQTPVLGHSYYSHDSYSFSGQGIGGYFRGRRSDVGRINDPKMHNNIYGLNGSLEFSTSSLNVTTIYTNPSGTQTSITQHPPGKKIGFGVNLTFGWMTQGAWNVHNNEKLQFSDPGTSGKKENHYYQVHGQPTVLALNELSHIAGEEKFRPKLTYAGAERGIEGASNLTDFRQNQDRVVRNTLVHNFNNSELARLPEFSSVRATAYSELSDDGSGSKVMLRTTTSAAFDRNERSMTGYGSVPIGAHNAGYKVLNEDGSYYVYALPAYNRKEVNNLFSVNATLSEPEYEPTNIEVEGSEVKYKHANTDKFIHKTTQSPYAHSYMLTAIFGADYVDVTQDGPTDDDLGYWVKFDYVKYADDYRWRAPYYGAFLNKGAHHTTEDDKASYTYGEKEIWYLGRIETKTHVAVYHMSKRRDNAEAGSEFSNTAEPQNARFTGLKIDKISLHVKSEYDANGVQAKALQEVHFRYDYSLCPNTINNDQAVEVVDNVNINSAKGKLTLKSIWFTAQGSRKGEYNKYKFHYDSGDALDNPELQNPSYAFNRIDGWGGFKPGGNFGFNKYFPYTDQFNQWPAQGNQAYQNNVNTFEDAATKAAFKRHQDQFVSAWSLKRIELPSGGEIKVDYESDDYAYVQDQEATQMFKITSVNNSVPGDDKLYDHFEGVEHPSSRRIYFKLEYPVQDMTSDLNGSANLIYNKYVKNLIKDENGERNLFFKSYIQLKDLKFSGNEQDDYEAVSGYLPLEEGATGTYDNTIAYYCGLSSTLVNGYHTHGYITVKQLPKKNGGTFNFHPMAILAWQYMQTNTPKLMHDFANIDEGASGNFWQQISNLLNVIPAFMSSVGATRSYAKMREFAQKIDLNRSVIRLCSPDKKKFGGGHRVRKITITDAWNSMAGSESSRTYGTEYDYTMKDDDGSEISSGVAQYEPSMIGDENALKYPLHFHGRNTVVSNNNLFAEHPFNEDLYPGASVGYRKITVKSLNTGNKLRNAAENSGRMGGITVYSFYTAKEFPTISEYTPFSDENNDYRGVLNLPLPIPFIGAYYRKYYHASQAFKIELNDMHGKPKSVESYEIRTYEDANDVTHHEILGQSITSVTYEYQTKNWNHNGHNVMRLHNKVNIVSRNNPTQLGEERDMGVEYDMFTDQRQSKSHVVTAGLEVNLDWPVEGVPYFVPSFWPAFTTNKTLTRTYVTNKVIFKTGILKRTVTRDLQSNSSSEIVAYDEFSGQPLIAKGTNEFGDEIYSYSIPAYWNYDRMGHAYKNINYSFYGLLVQPDYTPTDNAGSFLYLEPQTDEGDMLVRGDELLFTKGTESFKAYVTDFFYDANNYKRILLHIPNFGLSSFNSNGQFGGFVSQEGTNQPIGRVIRSGRRNHYDAIGASYATKGSPFANIDGTQALVDGLTTPKLDNVIGASATLYRDDWDNSLTVDESNGDLVSNPFLSGHSGIWRPYKSYTYAGSRTKSMDMAGGTASGDPDLRNDGVMNDVPMFSWEIGNIEDYVPQWEWASEITRYNRDSYEVENVDRLGIKSSALFGMGENLSLAVGGNAGYHELGVADFENTALSSSVFLQSLGYSNLSFYAGSPGVFQQYTSESAKIKDCYRNANGTLSLFLDLESSVYTQFMNLTNNRVGLGLISRKTTAGNANTGHYLNASVDNANVQSYLDNGVSKVKLILNSTYLSNGPTNLPFIKDGEHYYGRATFLINRSNVVPGTVNGVTFSSTKAHTGKRSMSLTQNASFVQKELQLKKGVTNKYVLSMWVSRDNANQYRFTTTGSDLMTLSQVNPINGAVTSVPSGTLKYTCSKVIEGWQKIDVVFNTDVDYGVLRINFTPGASALYVDDMRLSPFTGGITTNVYDPTNYRLRASLNADNYATFYYYDEQGNLVMTKQETENGIVTLNEARGNARKTQ